MSLAQACLLPSVSAGPQRGAVTGPGVNKTRSQIFLVNSHSRGNPLLLCTPP